MKMFVKSFIVCFLLLRKTFTRENIVVFHVNEIDNIEGRDSVRSASNYFTNLTNINVDLQSIEVNTSDPQSAVKLVCKAYKSLLDSRHPPHLILETGFDKTLHEIIKFLSSSIQIPTVTTNSQADYKDSSDFDIFIKVTPPHRLLMEKIDVLTKEFRVYRSVFILDNNFKSVGNFARELHSVKVLEFDIETIHELYAYLNEGITNIFYFGNSSNAKWFLQTIIENQKLKKNLTWFILTFEREHSLFSKFENENVVFLNPILNSHDYDILYGFARLSSITPRSLNLMDFFYFKIAMKSFFAISKLERKTQFSKNLTYLSCNDHITTATVPSIPFRKYFIESNSTVLTKDRIFKTYDKVFHLPLNFKLRSFNKIIGNKTDFLEGKWNIGFSSAISLNKIKKATLPVLRIVTVMDRLYINKNLSAPHNISGLYVDLLNILATSLNFEYRIEICKNIGDFPQGNYEWDGALKEIIEKRADLLLARVKVNSAVKNVVDLSLPLDKFNSGFRMIGRRFTKKTNIFEFLTVLNKTVWFSLIGAYFVSSIYCWLLNRYNPLNQENSQTSNKLPTIVFSFKDSLWYCLMIFTPQGAALTQQALPGKIFSASLWIFSFISITFYIANLSAFMTVPKTYSKINTIDDLLHQHEIAFGPYVNSNAYWYFKNMEHIENLFFEEWKRMTLNANPQQRSKFVTWDYPVKETYTKFFKQFGNDLPLSFGSALERVRKIEDTKSEFIYVGETAEDVYLKLTECDFKMVGKQFAEHSHALAFQSKSALKDMFNEVILRIITSGEWDKIRSHWANNHPLLKICQEDSGQIQMTTILGVFMILFMGIGTAYLVIAFEYFIHVRKSTGSKNS